MDISQQIDRIRTEGMGLLAAAESGPLDSPVKGCPGWDVETLLRHIAHIHRWAAMIVRERPAARLRRGHEGPDERDALLAWYRDGWLGLVDALEGASDEDEFWYWGPAPNALAFWSRRQANETAVHRCDAESARGTITPLSAADGADGLDEWLGLAALRAHAAAGAGRSLRLVASDGDDAWCVTLAERLEVRDCERADCELLGTASDLFLWSMNRQGTDRISVTGDATLLTVWANNVRF